MAGTEAVTETKTKSPSLEEQYDSLVEKTREMTTRVIDLVRQKGIKQQEAMPGYPEVHCFKAKLADGRSIYIHHHLRTNNTGCDPIPEELKIYIPNTRSDQLGYSATYYLQRRESEHYQKGLTCLGVQWLEGWGRVQPVPKENAKAYQPGDLGIIGGLGSLETYQVILKLAVEAMTTSNCPDY